MKRRRTRRVLRCMASNVARGYVAEQANVREVTYSVGRESGEGGHRLHLPVPGRPLATAAIPIAMVCRAKAGVGSVAGLSL
jgi:hypothetical protein